MNLSGSVREFARLSASVKDSTQVIPFNISE